MNASALLTAQGWSGPSTPLNPHSATANTHITKPLLISQKKNTLGVGNNPLARYGQNQWWLRDFDETLKGIGRPKGGKGDIGEKKVVGGVLGAQGSVVGKGLYGWFVRGEVLEGTIKDSESERVSEVEKEERPRKKRRRQGERETDVEVVRQEGGDRSAPGSTHDEDADVAKAERKKRRKERRWKDVDEGNAESGVEEEPQLGPEPREVAGKEKTSKKVKREKKLAELERQLQDIRDCEDENGEYMAENIRKLEKRIRKKRAKLMDYD